MGHVRICCHTVIYGNAVINEGCFIGSHCVIGHPPRSILKADKPTDKPTILGSRCVIRSGSVVYSDVTLGDEVELGHNVLIREGCRVGSKTLIGTGSVIDGYSEIGREVRMQTGVYVSAFSTVGDGVFLGPYSKLLNDKYMARKPYELKGPNVKNGASIGGGAILMPRITVGEGAVIGAGSLVLEDVPPRTIYVGVPAKKLSNVPDDWR